jgi:hypothetical protein
MMTNEEQSATLLTEQQVAVRLGVTIYCLRKWRARKIGPSYVKLSDNIASGVRYDARDLEGWIEGRKQHPRPRS